MSAAPPLHEVELQETERFVTPDGSYEVTARHALLRLPSPRADVHYVKAGDEASPTVLLLHGFPDSHKSWRFQIPALVRAGYRVLAPDLRGYGRSGKPTGVTAYGPDPVTDDLAELLRAEMSSSSQQSGEGGESKGRARAAARAVVGHDWGAAVAYAFAARHGTSLEKLVILNGVHPSVFLKFVLSNPIQLLKSYYIGFFQLPVIPEAVISAGDYAILRAIFRFDPKQPLPAADAEDVIDACSQEGALEASLNYYRAAGPLHNLWSNVGKCEVPLQVQWGAGDRYLEEAIAIPNADVAPLAAPLVRHTDATHWVQWDEPEAVSRALIDFLDPALETDEKNKIPS